jgi:dolichyl-phosphate-mannose--protein O-mannosyl transferase
MAAYLFSWFALALIIETLLNARQSLSRQVGWGVLALITLGFVYWLPVFLGLPLTSEAFYLRMLFKSWI